MEQQTTLSQTNQRSKVSLYRMLVLPTAQTMTIMMMRRMTLTRRQPRSLSAHWDQEPDPMSENQPPRLTRKDWGKELRKKKLNCSLQSLPVKNSAPEHRARNTPWMKKQKQRHQGSKVEPGPGPRLGPLKLMKCLPKQKMMSLADLYHLLDLAAGVQRVKSARDLVWGATDSHPVGSLHPQVVTLRAQAFRSSEHRVSHLEIDSNLGSSRLNRKIVQQERPRLLGNLHLLISLQYLIRRKTKIKILLS